MIVNENEYTWSRHLTTVSVGTTEFEQPVKIYAIKGDGSAYVDAEMTTPIISFPIAVDSITVTGAELTLIGEQGRGVPVSSEFLDTANGMTALEWASRSDKFTITLPFPFKWNGVEITEFILYASGAMTMEGTTIGIRIHSYWLYSWGEPTNGIYWQTGTSGNRRFLKIRFDGRCYYNNTTDAAKSKWELFIFDDGSMFVNSIYCPTLSTYNYLYLNSAQQTFTVVPGGSQYIIATSADNGVTWAFDYLDGSQKTVLFLVRKGDTLHTVIDGALTPTDITDLTAAAFLEHGFAALSDFKPEGEYGILCWSTGTAPTVTAKLTGSPPPQELTCTVDMGHSSIAGIQQLSAEYSGTVELSHKITGGEWSTPIDLGEWVAQDCETLWESLGEDGQLYLKFYLYGGAQFTRFKVTFKN